MENSKLKQFKRNADRDDDLLIKRGLSKIYSNKDGSLPDISHLEVKRKSRWKVAIISSAVIIFLLAAISWLGFIIFNPDYQFKDQSINLEIDGPKNIASGDEVTYKIKYKNVEKVILKNVELIFRYPDGFEFVSANPAPTNNFNSSWKLGDLARGQSGTIEITGRLIGEVGSLKSINVTASFEPENFSSIFKETFVYNSQITSSILEISLEGPNEILPEKKGEYKIKYRNSSDQNLENVKIVATYPSTFVFQKATPEPFSREDDARKFNNQWVFETLEQNQEGEIVIIGGYLIDDQVSDVDFKTEIGFFDPESQEFSLQQEKIIQTKVINHGLSLQLIVNGANQDQPVSFGQNLTYSLVYKNLGQNELDDIQFSVQIDSDVIDWAGLEDKHNGIVKDNIITWNKDQISEFDLIRPLDEGTINFSVPIKESSQININQDNLQTVSKATALIPKIGDLETEDLTIETDPITNNINTDIQLKVEGRYFDDDNIAVGTGPLPPVVGQKTTFRIYWSIANSLNTVDDVTVKTFLPDGVEWADKFLLRSGNISYSEQNNAVVWSIDRIRANEGFDQHNIWFDVAVIPTKQQVKKLLILTDQATLKATDQTTDAEITKIGKAVTSNLEDDPIGSGRGLVIDITE